MPAILLTAGCATNYKPEGKDGGYSQKKLADAVYRVSYSGNVLSSQARIWYFWIYRCAELSKEQGFELFTVGFPEGVAAERQVDSATVHGGPTGPKASGRVTMLHAPVPPEVSWALDAQKVLDALRPYARSNGQTNPPSRLAVYRQALAGPIRVELGDIKIVQAAQKDTEGDPRASRSIADFQSLFEPQDLVGLYDAYRLHRAQTFDPMSGTVRFAYTVTPNGFVKDVRVVSSVFRDRLFLSRIAAIVADHNFLARDAAATRVEIPVSFELPASTPAKAPGSQPDASSSEERTATSAGPADRSFTTVDRNTLPGKDARYLVTSTRSMTSKP